MPLQEQATVLPVSTGSVLAVQSLGASQLTVLEGLSLRAAAAQLQISPMAVQRAQKKALAALRQQLLRAG